MRSELLELLRQRCSFRQQLEQIHVKDYQKTSTPFDDIEIEQKGRA